MKVLYTCDNNYVWLMGISVISLCENNRDIEELKIYLLGENISIFNKDKLQEIAEQYKREIVIIDVPKINIPQSLLSARWPLSAFTRLYAGQLLPEDVEKILYLDCDTIIKGSIEYLDHINMEGYVLLGVKDCISGEYKKNIGLNVNDAYVNAGVLLLDLSRLRKLQINTIIDEYMCRYEKYINYADQDVLNGIFRGKIGILPALYNVMTMYATYSYEEIMMLRRPGLFYKKQELEEAVENPIIIHYTTNMRTVRPWYKNTNHPLATEFERYKKISIWNTRVLDEMVFKSAESKVISIVERLPKPIAYRLLGLMHSILKPFYIRIKATV